MHTCKCGGVVRQHPLTRNREAWTCNACGRYDVIERSDLKSDLTGAWEYSSLKPENSDSKKTLDNAEKPVIVPPIRT